MGNYKKFLMIRHIHYPTRYFDSLAPEPTKIIKILHNELMLKRGKKSISKRGQISKNVGHINTHQLVA